MPFWGKLLRLPGLICFCLWHSKEPSCQCNASYYDEKRCHIQFLFSFLAANIGILFGKSKGKSLFLWGRIPKMVDRTNFISIFYLFFRIA